MSQMWSGTRILGPHKKSRSHHYAIIFKQCNRFRLIPRLSGISLLFKINVQLLVVLFIIY